MRGPGIRTRLRQLLAVLLFLALTSVAQVAFAASDAPAPPPQAPPSNAQGGVNTLVEPPPIQGQSQPMLFEQYGPLDYAGLTTSFGAGSVNVINDEGNGEATAEATAMYLLGIVSTRIVEWCFSLNLVSQLGGTIDSFTTGLKDTLYQQYLPLIVVLAAIVAGWTVLVMRRFLGGLTGILWAGFTIALALQLFNAPSQYLDRADQFATGATNAIVTGVAQEDPGEPPGSYQQAGGNPSYEVRLLANRLWVVSVYDPWTMVEFGTVDPRAKNGDQLGVELLKKNDGQSNSYDQDIQTAPQWIQQWADGNWGVPRAMFGLFLVVLGGILLAFTLLIALTVIVGTLAAIVLGCLTVPVWLLAPIPGFGQRLLVSWFGGIFAGLAVSTVGALYLVVVLALLGAVQQLEASVGLITVGVLDVGLIVVALWLRKSFFRFGRHIARLPVAAVAGQPLAVPARDRQTATVSVHRTTYDRQRVPAPSAATARYAGAAGTKAGAAGVPSGGATTVGATAGASAATAGAALLALGAAKAARSVSHARDATRARVRDLADVTLALPAGLSPEHRSGHSQNGHLQNGHAQNGHHQLALPGRVEEPGRVARSGVRSFRGPRVDPPKGAAATGDGARSAKGARRPIGSSPKGKRRRVEAPKP
ncbi:MAG: hypothetical protein J2P43_03155 [Candidatus Dormibacteraeota bacterium]|nr:hypothetical protein [Candidatus Dormibacteraeota bacterium]